MSVLFAEVAAPTDLSGDPEDLREVVGQALARAINEVEGLGGTVTSVSGGGLQALFGAPEAHEDDPERALRAAFRALSAQTGVVDESPSVLRIGVETGPAVVGHIGAGARFEYGAVGAVASTAAALQSLARPGSTLVGPATRAAVEDVFEWGPTEVVTLVTGAKPLVGSYLEGPKARAPSRQTRLGGRGPLVGRHSELSVLEAALRHTEGGRGSVVILVGEPGLGKTRLVQECRKRFIAWVGARSGRLPLWLEGRCASYASTTPYGLYQHLLASWVGVAPDQGEAVVGPALDRALTVLMGNKDLWPALARMMGLPGGAGLARMSPQELQRVTFGAMRAGRIAPGGYRPHRTCLGGPALGRPDLAPAHRGALFADRERPAVVGPHPPTRARPRRHGTRGKRRFRPRRDASQGRAWAARRPRRGGTGPVTARSGRGPRCPRRRASGRGRQPSLFGGTAVFHGGNRGAGARPEEHGGWPGPSVRRSLRCSNASSALGSTA